MMLRLNFVKAKKEDDRQQYDKNEQTYEEILHGTRLLKLLVKQWFFTDPVVCAESWFASLLQLKS